MRVEVLRSTRRRKTVQARQRAGVLQVSIPATMTRAEEEHWVAEMVRRMEQRRAGAAIDLMERATDLAARYGLQRPDAIRWSEQQQARWGSCTPSRRTVRISTLLVPEPVWVLDYVIVHELAHLDVPRHDAAFWALVGRYPLAERARGFLIARSTGGHHTPDPHHAPSPHLSFDPHDHHLSLDGLDPADPHLSLDATDGLDADDVLEDEPPG